MTLHPKPKPLLPAEILGSPQRSHDSAVPHKRPALSAISIRANRPALCPRHVSMRNRLRRRVGNLARWMAKQRHCLMSAPFAVRALQMILAGSV